MSYYSNSIYKLFDPTAHIRRITAPLDRMTKQISAPCYQIKNLMPYTLFGSSTGSTQFEQSDSPIYSESDEFSFPSRPVEKADFTKPQKTNPFGVKRRRCPLTEVIHHFGGEYFAGHGFVPAIRTLIELIYSNAGNEQFDIKRLNKKSISVDGSEFTYSMVCERCRYALNSIS